jgi:phosphocarrier protein HPr
MIRQSTLIANRLGLHARAAAKLVKVASGFRAHATISTEHMSADAKSILGVLTLAAGKDTPVTIEVEGPDESDAVTAILDLFEGRFGED